VLIVISGLPGTGKTAVAAGLAARIGAVHLSIDPIEDALLGAGLAPTWETGVAAYEATRVAAELNLALGWSVVVDAVNDSGAARQTWRDAADRTSVSLRFVMLTCSDTVEHRRRLENRRRGLANVGEPTWEQVGARAARYEPWAEPCPTVDTVAALDEVIDRIHREVVPQQ
jgi:predicted kinase